MKKILLSLLLAGTVQNSFVMGSCGGGGRAAQSGGQAAESGFRLEGRIPVIFKDGLVVYLDLQRLRALNSGVLQGSLFTEEGLSRLGEVLEGNPFDMTRFVNLEDFEKFEKILKGQLSSKIRDMVKFIEDANFLDIDLAQYLRELKTKHFINFFTLCAALLADKIDPKEPKPVKQDFTILLEKAIPAILFEAIQARQFEAAKLLIAAGADVNARDNSGWTALTLAASENYTEIMQLLIAAGADINAKGNEEFTPLMWAAHEGHTKSVQILIDKKADLNARDNRGWTALKCAEKNNHPEIVRILVNSGADINIRYDEGWTALLRAVDNSHPETARILIEAGADVDACNVNGYTAIMSAVRQGLPEIVRILIAARANVNATDNLGITTLMRAVIYGRIEEARLLIDAGADVNASDRYGQTVLMHAARWNRTEIVQLLRDAGAR